MLKNFLIFFPTSSDNLLEPGVKVPDSVASAALPTAYRGGEISSKNRARAEMREGTDD